MFIGRGSRSDGDDDCARGVACVPTRRKGSAAACARAAGGPPSRAAPFRARTDDEPGQLSRRRTTSWTSNGRARCRRAACRPNSFTGTVWQDPIIEAPAPARIRGAWVRFEPKARTAWHTHPLGQTLHVVSGIGPRAALGRPARAKSGRRHGLDRAGREALARRRSRHRHGAHRAAGGISTAAM